MRLIDGLYAAAMGEREWSAVIHELEATFGAAGATIFDVDLGAGAVVDIVANRLAPKQSEYVDRMNAINPRMLRALRQPGPHVAVDYDELSEQALLRNEFYDWLMRECGVKYFIGARMIDNGPIMSFASVDFTARHGHASEEEVALFRSLVPHVANAWRLSRQLSEMKTLTDVALRAAERASVGIIGLAADGRVVTISREAERILNADDGMFVRKGELHAARSATDRTLQIVLAQALRTASDENDMARTMLAIPRRSGGCDYVLEIAACAGRRKRQSHGAAVVFLFVTEPGAGKVGQQALRDLYGLTPREADLAVLLQQGGTLADAASAMQVAHNTARVHLASILKKTGAASRAELMGLLGHIRAPASNVRGETPRLYAPNGRTRG